jgi:hypothetical protein
MVIIIVLIGAVWLAWFIYTNRQPAIGVTKNDEGRDVTIEVAEGYDFLSFGITGTSFRRGLSKYVGEFDGSLVAEPSNPYDPNAIKIVAADGHHLGYIPRDETEDVREFLPLPCDCHGILQKGRDDDGHVFYWGKVVIVRKR